MASDNRLRAKRNRRLLLLTWLAVIIASIFLAAPFIYLAIEG